MCVREREREREREFCLCEGSIYSAKEGGVGTRSICLYKAKSAPGERERGGKSERERRAERDENRQARTERKRIRRQYYDCHPQCHQIGLPELQPEIQTRA